MELSSALLLLGSLVTAYLLHALYRFYNHRRWFKGLPQPPHSFLWGHLKVLGEVASTLPPNMHPQAYYTTLALKHNLKGIFYLDLWPVADPQVVLIDPDLMTQVTVTKSLAKHKLTDDALAPVTGRNVIVALDGPEWKRLRNAMAPAFSTHQVRNMVPVMVQELKQFRSTLEKHALAGDTFSMEHAGAKVLFDISGRIVFNLPLHAQTGGSAYLDDLREMISLGEAQFSWNPRVRIHAFFRRKVINKRLRTSIEATIRERLNILKKNGFVAPSRKDPHSILDLMLLQKFQGDTAPGVNGKDTEELDEEYLELLISNLKGLLVGGHGTSNDTFCYMLILISKSPRVIQKLREEHTRVFHESFEETLNILQDAPHKLNDLEYTTAVIHETLRLFPVGFGVRVAAQDATITYNGQSYPLGRNLVVVPNSHSVHYSPEYYHKPDEFIPERWLDTDHPVPRAYFHGFSRGPRACMGQTLAQDQLKVILLMILRDYEFECADLKPNPKPKAIFSNLDLIYGDIVFQELGFEAKPRGQVMMKVSKRN